MREAGWRCVVVDAPFVHRGGGTRTGEGAPVAAPEDLAQRRAALARFAREVAPPAAVRRPRAARAPARLARGAAGGIITRMIPFAKGHGLGNDYIVINAADLPAALTTPQITRICDRNWGVGSDGILLLTPPWDGADFGLRILNPDGSEAEKSGNGLRIFAKYLHDHGHAKKATFTVATKGGRVECTLPRGGWPHEPGHGGDGALHLRRPGDPDERARARGGEGAAAGGRGDPADHRGIGRAIPTA